ncbi:hypothetical protein [Phenylobacterium sp.]|jgi:hypothetical protein|uniref:hypothetical protein n=1 Tax=Phenylobacterium sp. TaxID=1871053 RepID=UPI002E37841C|nr:hypothetical protein [Phenylobacterium sp.]HEX4712910.1 hypothetical protein [Phenylobacterium sp.]
MIGFRGKLRRFVSNWVSGEPAASAPPLSFIFNADDTPRLWSEDAAAAWPPHSPAAPEKEFPRFANMATHEGARLAA